MFIDLHGYILCVVMGGHSAWRKRIAAGELAKGSGGAIARHRPHFGRKGEDLKLNRKGNIAGGNPKKRKSSKAQTDEERNNSLDSTKNSTEPDLRGIIITTVLAVLSISFSAAVHKFLVR